MTHTVTRLRSTWAQEFTSELRALRNNQNTRLLTEQREALAQQTATAEVLRVIASSPGNLAPVFDTMLERATRLCEAASGVLWVAEGECFHAVASLRLPAAFAEYLRTPLEGGPDTGSAEARRLRTRTLPIWQRPQGTRPETHCNGRRLTLAGSGAYWQCHCKRTAYCSEHSASLDWKSARSPRNTSRFCRISRPRQL